MKQLFKPLPWPPRWSRPWQEPQPRCELTSCLGPKSPWHRIWHRRKSGTRLQGAYYCQPACIETALVNQLVRLQALAPEPQPPSRIPLGLLMVARGRLTYREVEAALEAQRRARYGKIGEWFEKLGFATEKDVTSALGLQWGCPVASSLDLDPIDPAHRIPLVILEAFHMLPLHHVRATNSLYIAFGERVDHALLYTIEKMLDCRTQPCVAGRRSVAVLLERMRQQPRLAEVEFGPMHDPVEMGRIGSSYITRFGAEEVRLGRVGRFIWLRLKACSTVMNLVFRLRTEPLRTGILATIPLLPRPGLLQRAFE